MHPDSCWGKPHCQLYCWSRDVAPLKMTTIKRARPFGPEKYNLLPNKI